VPREMYHNPLPRLHNSFQTTLQPRFYRYKFLFPSLFTLTATRTFQQLPTAF